jgi:hypothetical protein
MKIKVYIKHDSYDARGEYNPSDNSIIVFQGARFRKKTPSGFAKSSRYAVYDLLIKENALSDEFILNKDYRFTSSSLAASLIRGISTNGMKYWQVEDENISLKEHLEIDVTLEPIKDQFEFMTEFLKDIDVLESIEQNQDFNVFSTLKIINAEIRHSNVLAWLLNPYETHGLKDFFTKQLIRAIYLENLNYFKEDNLTSIFLWDFTHATVYREKDHIDILLVDEINHFVLAIENKIWTSEHDGQLTRYKENIYKLYPTTKYKHFFVYLSTEDEEVSDDTWISISYELIISTLEKTLPVLKDKVKSFVIDYLNILRRNIMEDDKLAKLCKEIYSKHRQALDLIYQYKPDHFLTITDSVKEVLSQNENIILNQSNKKIVRFASNTLKEVNDKYRQSGHKWVKDNSVFLYEVKIHLKQLVLVLVIGPTIDETRANLIQKYQMKTNRKFNQTQKWTTLDKVPIISIKDIENTEDITEEIEKKLLDKVSEFIKNNDHILSDF